MSAQDYRLAMPALASWWTVLLGPQYALYIGSFSLVLIVLLSIGVGRKTLSRYTPTIFVVCLAGCCASMTTTIHHEAAQRGLIAYVYDLQLSVTATGRIESFPIDAQGSTRFIFRTFEAQAGADYEQSQSLLDVKISGSANVERYDVVQIEGVVEKCQYQGISDMCFSARTLRLVQPAQGWHGYVGRIHKALQSYDESTAVVHDALLTGIAIGDDSRLPQSYREKMRVLGLAHLTAVSGAHISMIILIVVMLVGWRWPVITGLSSCVAIVGLTTVVDPQPSVSRAALMGLLYSLGIGMRYSVTAFPLLALTVIVSSLFEPNIARSLGFILSVIAVAAIVAGGAPVAKYLSTIMPKWVGETIAVPYIAGVVTIPLIAGFQQELSVFSVIANVLVAPVIFPLTILGLVGGFLMPLIPALATYFLAIAQVCSGWIDIVVELVPVLSFTPYITGLIVSILGLIALYAVHRRYGVAKIATDVGY
ncbi:ComEC/Rec2 family competence protein [Arcanobacterium pinnipediorum]|uniref:ComEC/Rec2 family competence protein n=1 Tax=Arcanobacterium pinnipediorum TaxID=1503041 RepID=A0ABY5AFI6_9ACTO|nr:ComEC/Rec2 family competence protein [Arcanobacterium pinnipediorum]USR78756.1 ComEC/Rec2 family competence protein [Arcanobacterium pinnipediorum]